MKWLYQLMINDSLEGKDRIAGGFSHRYGAPILPKSWRDDIVFSMIALCFLMSSFQDLWCRGKRHRWLKPPAIRYNPYRDYVALKWSCTSVCPVPRSLFRIPRTIIFPVVRIVVKPFILCQILPLLIIWICRKLFLLPFGFSNSLAFWF